MLRYSATLVVFCLFSLAAAVLAGPLTREEGDRRAKVWADLTKALNAEPAAAEKFAILGKAMKEERAVDLRRRIIEKAAEIDAPDREAFLASILASDADAGLRGRAAKLLGHLGSEKALAPLAEAAANDRTTSVEIGDIGGQSSARRDATFALAELATRHPAIAKEAEAKLRALPAVAKEGDSESLADARLQALYQITRDDALIRPFVARLKSPDASVRVDGVVAMRFLALKEAPPELLAALKDSSSDVRSWAALVLGEVGDAKTIDALMATAGNTDEDTGIRANAIYSLGNMKAAPASGLLEKLLDDKESAVRSNAAMALYRITGKKVPQLPKGIRK